MRQALELALEALEWNFSWAEDFWDEEQFNVLHKAITALRQAIEQAQKQEPLCTAAMFDDAFLAKSGLSPDTKLYTSPPQRQPLTDEQIEKIFGVHNDGGDYYALHWERDITRAIEPNHGIKGEA